MNLIAAEDRVSIIAGGGAEALRFGDSCRGLTSDLLAFKHGSEIQKVQARHRVDITLRVIRVAYLTPQHLETSANTHERLTGSRMRFDHLLPSVFSEPKQIGDRVLTAGQDQDISRARF